MRAPRRLLPPLVLAALAGCASHAPAVTASGTIELTEAHLAPEQSARVDRLLVAEGDRVCAGDTLAVLTSTTLPAETRQMEAAVAQADAELAELRRGARAEEIALAHAAVADAEATASRTASDARRMEVLLRHGGASAQQAERAAADDLSAAARLEQARQSLALLRAGASPEQVAAAVARRARAVAALEAARAQGRDLVLTAPAAGVVTGRYREPGELAPAGRAVLTVADPAAPWVRVYVRQAALPGLAIGQAGVVRLDEGDETFSGRVVAIGHEAEYTPRVALTEDERADLMFAVRLTLDDSAGRLKAGLPVTVTLPAADDARRRVASAAGALR